MRRIDLRYFVVISIVATLSSMTATQIWAQAGTPWKGEGALSFVYQYTKGGDHLFSTDIIDGFTTRGYTAEGNRWYLGDTFAHTIIGGIDYGIIDRLALTVEIAYVSSKYEGNAPLRIEVDDGEWHGSFQDARIQLRGMVVTHPFLLTPFVSYGFPTNGYFTEGHSAIGRGLNEFQFGTFFLTGFGGVLPGAYLQASISYGILEDVADLNLARPRFAGAVSYSFSHLFSGTVTGSYFNTKGGLEWVSDDPTEIIGHDEVFSALLNQVVASRMATLGVGLAYSPWSTIGIFANLSSAIWGENVEISL